MVADLRVDVINPYKLILDENLAFFRRRDGEIASVLQDLCAAGFLNEHAFHGFGDWEGRHWTSGGGWGEGISDGGG